MRMIGQITREWRAALAPDRAAHARRVARDVASRLRDRGRLGHAAALAVRQSKYPALQRWEPHSVAHGYAGLSLLWGYLDALDPTERWDLVAHRDLTEAAEGARATTAPELGLFCGLTGLAFAAYALSRGGRRYQRLLGALEDALLPRISEIVEREPPWHRGVSVGYFDAISGLSGIAAYLLCRRECPPCDRALGSVLRRLTTLVAECDGVPRWYTAPEFLTEDALEESPDGNLNCGLAHGVPGPLAVLSIAALLGVQEEGMLSGIDRAAAWLAFNRADDEWGVNWSYTMPPPASRAESIVRPSRAAWCYGSPGVARALWLAGTALDDTRYCDLAANAMSAVIRRPVAQREIDSPTFCHGVSGFLQIALRFANDTRDPSFIALARDLTEQLLALHCPDRVLGYCGLEDADTAVDSPGLLDGAPGVALTLLAAASDVEPAWDRLFLLA
jgi:hypothetical protein